MPVFAWDGPSNLELGGTVVTWLQAVPVSDSEFRHLRQNSVDALETLIEERDADVADLDRAPAVSASGSESSMTAGGAAERAAAREAEHVIAKAVESAGVRDAEKVVGTEASKTAEKKLVASRLSTATQWGKGKLAAARRTCRWRALQTEPSR